MSSNVRPSFSEDEPSYSGLCDAVLEGKVPLGHAACCISGADCPHIIFSQQGATVADASASFADSLSRGCVVLLSAPLKVLSAIIGSVVILVANNHVRGGRQADKGQRNHTVNEVGASLPISIKRDVHVLARVGRLQDFSTVLGVTAWLFGLHPSQVGNQISLAEGLIWDREPCFVFHTPIISQNVVGVKHNAA
jgi:hypothetical protein